MTLYSIYRISDKGSENKEKLRNATKMHCLDNFIQEFGTENLLVLADNCSKETLNEIKIRTKNIHKTKLNNSGTILYALNYAVDNFDQNDSVYLCEDDYLHLKGARKKLLEGLEIADYVSLYDHIDKYIEGANLFVKNGGETSRVIITQSTHWKTTNSTTMTFASKVQTIKEDKKIFEAFCKPGQDPKDFTIFRLLTNHTLFPEDSKYISINSLKQRTLISPIPSVSTHCELRLLAPFIDWSKV